MKLLTIFSLIALINLPLTVMAQSEPTNTEEETQNEGNQLPQLKLPEQIALPCEVLNPADLKNSDELGNYSLDTYNSVVIIYEPYTGRIFTSVKLFAGRFSLAPSKPRIYKTVLSPGQNAQSELTLKNTNRAELDKVVLSPNLNLGKIILDNDVEIQISCSQE